MNKRGESIVEVVVACGVLSLLFVAVATIIGRTVALNDGARLRMEAVSVAQTELNEFVVSGINGKAGGSGTENNPTSGSCSIDLVDATATSSTTSTAISGDIVCKNISDKDLPSYFSSNPGLGGKCSYITVRKLLDTETNGGIVDSNKFIAVESSVRWISRSSGPEIYTIRKLLGAER